jgi:hypothetical protein
MRTRARRGGYARGLILVIYEIRLLPFSQKDAIFVKNGGLKMRQSIEGAVKKNLCYISFHNYFIMSNMLIFD